MSARSWAGSCTVSVYVELVCSTRNGRSSPLFEMVVNDGPDEEATWYPCGSMRLQPRPLAAWSGVATTRSERTHPARVAAFTWYQTFPEASGARWSAIAWAPCERM